MSLSKDYDASRFFEEAVSDLGLEQNWDLYRNRFSLCNRAVSDVLEQIFPLVFASYLTSATLQVGSGSKYSTTSTGTWVASTRTLTFAGMSAPFADSDVGKVVTFRISGDTFLGTIDSQTGGTAIVVSGHSLPTSNGTVAEVTVVPTTPTADFADISSLRICQLEGSRLTLISSAIDQPCQALTVEKLHAFRSSGLRSKQKIVFAREEGRLLLRKGDSVGSLGTLTLWYGRQANQIVGDTDAVDLPDGNCVTLGILRLKSILAARAGLKVDLSQEASLTLNALYQSFGRTLADEENKKKTVALTGA
jgi:hypothetical protein